MNSQLTAYAKKVELFLALSRTPHLLIDLATPMVAALCAWGDFPNLRS